MPLGMNVGENIRELREANRGRGKPRPQKVILAIALSAARRAGADVGAPKKKLGIKKR